MFVRPEQIADIGKRHPELGRCGSSSRSDRCRNDNEHACQQSHYRPRTMQIL
jgi:hypothetical protein